MRTAARELRAAYRLAALFGDGRIVGVFRVLFRRVDACIAVVVSRFCSHIPARVREHTSREMRQARTFAAVFRNHVKVERSARWIATGAACCAIDRRTAIRPTATFVEQRSTFATVNANVDAVVVGWKHDGALDCLNALIAVDHIGPRAIGSKRPVILRVLFGAALYCSRARWTTVDRAGSVMGIKLMTLVNAESLMAIGCVAYKCQQRWPSGSDRLCSAA